MVGNGFYPKTLEMSVNTDIIRVNGDVFAVLDDERPGKHSILVAQVAETFASQELRHADKFHNRLSKVGHYEYTCPLYPYVKGKIKVY